MRATSGPVACAITVAALTASSDAGRDRWTRGNTNMTAATTATSPTATSPTATSVPLPWTARARARPAITAAARLKPSACQPSQHSPPVV